MGDECFACATAEGRAQAPGGVITETQHWLVDHCIGSLGVGTLIVKPKRHVVHVAGLTPAGAAELGPLLQRTSEVVTELTRPEQVYVTLWSHMGAVPVHIHFVVQPVTRPLMDELGVHGLRLQLAMFDRSEPPPPAEASSFAERARACYGRGGLPPPSMQSAR